MSLATVEPTTMDRSAILAFLNLRPNEVATQALLLICERYGLDPLMKHMVLISGKPYVTRDGYLHIAHQTMQLDGIEIVDEGESDKEWWAKVAVWRKDMGHPFTYRGRYPKDGQQKKYGPEMAIKTAEVMALRRAFDVTGVGAADEQWDEHDPGLPADLLARLDALPDDAQERISRWAEGAGQDDVRSAPLAWTDAVDRAVAAEERKVGEGAVPNAAVAAPSPLIEGEAPMIREAGGGARTAPVASSPSSNEGEDLVTRARRIAAEKSTPDAKAMAAGGAE